MTRRKAITTRGKTWNRRHDVMSKSPRIYEASIAAVLADEPHLNLLGIGYEAFGHMQSAERLDAMVQSRQKLLTDSEDDLREACKFLSILGVQNHITPTSPSAFWLVHLYSALARNGNWKPPAVSAGIIICAARILKIKISAAVYLRPDARLCLSTDKCAQLHRFCLRSGLYGQPMFDMPLGKPRGPRKKKSLLPEEGDISHMKNEMRAAYDKKGNGLNTIIPQEDFEKFNVPEVQDDDEIIEA